MSSTGLHRGILRVVVDIYIEEAMARRARGSLREQDGPFSGVRVKNRAGDVVVIELLPDHLSGCRFGEGEHFGLGQVRGTRAGRCILS